MIDVENFNIFKYDVNMYDVRDSTPMTFFINSVLTTSSKCHFDLKAIIYFIVCSLHGSHKSNGNWL